MTSDSEIQKDLKQRELKEKITDALKRSAALEADRIVVEANGTELTLKGTVRSWIEREEVENVARSAPGVTNVEDRIVVRAA